MDPAEGLSAQASTCSNVVLPAPEGPITATCSPLATCSSTVCNAAGESARAAGCRAETRCRLSFMTAAAPGSLEQAGVACRRLDAAVVFRGSGNEARGPLQSQDLAALGCFRAQVGEGFHQLFALGKRHVGMHRPVVVEI